MDEKATDSAAPTPAVSCTQRIAPDSGATQDRAWKSLVSGYVGARSGRAYGQILNSIGPYLALWYLMYEALAISWLLALPLAVLAGAFLVRVFIIFHDCGHGSFLASRRANRFWGQVTGVLTFTPFEHWRSKHAMHHGTAGNLDRRGIGDVWTMTVAEYRAASRLRRFLYRIARHPFVLLAIVPLYLFVIEQRIPMPGSSAREKRSVWFTTLWILGIGTGMSLIFGFLAYAILQLVVLAVAGATGVWLFYSQHQFDGAYWQRGADWSYEDAALRGSAYLRLPRILQWFTGNIGFHHVHHLDSRIPNYNLQACHESQPLFRSVAPLSAYRSLLAFRLKLWDENTGRLIRFGELTRPRELDTA